jgi:hypothetical protein
MRTLPDGSMMSVPEVEILHREAWVAFGEARRDGTVSPAKLQALEGRVKLASQVLYGVFDDEPTKMYPDADAHRPSTGMPAPHPIDEKISAAWAEWRKDPGNYRLQFRVEQLERQRAGG